MNETPTSGKKLDEMAPGEPRQHHYFGRPKPTIIGTEERPIDELGIETFKTGNVAFRRIGREGLDLSQDCWAFSTDSNGNRTLVATDGVGQALCGGWAAETVAATLSQNFEAGLNNFPTLDLDSLNSELLSQDPSKLLMEAWQEIIRRGAAASTTMVAIRIEGEKIEWRRVGDTGFIVVRPLAQARAELVEARLEPPGKKAPAQIVWRNERVRWEITGDPEEKGAVKVREGDVALIFSDGLLKGGDFTGKQTEEIIDLFTTHIGRVAFMTASKRYLPQIIATNVSDLGKAYRKPSDDVLIGVAVI